MNLPDLLHRIRTFRDERDWAQFHNAKDMAAALAIEASELQEIFLWKTGEEIDATAQKKRVQIEDEVADIAVYLLEFADNLGIDLEAAVGRSPFFKICEISRNIAACLLAIIPETQLPIQ